MSIDKVVPEDFFSSVNIIRLQDDYIIKPFNCDGADFDGFLFQEAKKNQKYLLSVTYLLESKEQTIAYYTVANDLLRVNLTNNRSFRSQIKKLSNDTFVHDLLKRETFPAVKIGILAVGKEFQNMGIGTKILDYLTYGFINNSNKTGCLFMTVDAVRGATRFYTKNGFKFYLKMIKMLMLDKCINVYYSKAQK